MIRITTALFTFIFFVACAQPEPAASIDEDTTSLGEVTIAFKDPPALADYEVGVVPWALVDSVLMLMHVSNQRLVYQGRAGQRPNCGPIQQIVFTQNGKKYTVWDTGDICKAGIRFYVRRLGSPMAGPRDSVDIMIDNELDGRIDQAAIAGSWLNFRDPALELSDASRSYTRFHFKETREDQKHLIYWQAKYADAIAASLEVLRPR